MSDTFSKSMRMPPNDVLIQGEAVESAKLIVREAAAVLEGVAQEFDKKAGENPMFATSAAMTRDHIRKLAWVHGLLEGKT